MNSYRVLFTVLAFLFFVGTSNGRVGIAIDFEMPCAEYSGTPDQKDGNLVKFIPGKFQGRFRIRADDSAVPAKNRYCFDFRGEQSRKLRAGVYFLQIGSDLSHPLPNPVSFTLSPAGEISMVSNDDAVTTESAPGAAIKFNTVPIRINPGMFTGNFKIETAGVDRPCVETSCELVRNLSYYVTFDGLTDGSFYFFVNAAGKIAWTSNYLAGWGPGSSLNFGIQQVRFSTRTPGPIKIQVGSSKEVLLPANIWIVANIPTKITIGKESRYLLPGYDRLIPSEIIFSNESNAGRVTLMFECIAGSCGRASIDKDARHN